MLAATMSDSIRIRPATPADAGIIVDFNQRLAWETEHKSLETETLAKGVAAVLADPSKGTYFVAEATEDAPGTIGARELARIVGQCSVTYEWSDWRNGMFWWLQSVYVAAPWRRRGVFRRLFAHVEGVARESGGAGLRLYVEEENHAAQETYRRHGMHSTAYRIFELEFAGAAPGV